MALKISDKLKLKGKDGDSKALSKVNKISEAQQYTLIAVFGASIFLGAAISMVIRFTDQISFNANVIAEEEQSIVSLSDIIKNIGICTAPKGTIYSDEELKQCSPNDIDTSSVEGTLRSNILQNMAANTALNSVPKQDLSYCLNNNTGKNFTYNELNELYTEAVRSEDSQSITTATELIQACSALRVIPDALPSYRNEEALFASLNRIFNMSNWEPESLSPSKDSGNATLSSNLYNIPIRLSVETDVAATMKILNNIERSIREFDIQRVIIEWKGESILNMESELNAYYTLPSIITKETKTINYGGIDEADDDIENGEIDE